MTAPDYKTLMTTPSRKTFGPARKKEVSLRRALAAQRAFTALRRLHRADYDVLLAEARAEIEAAGGPLPEDWVIR